MEAVMIDPEAACCSHEPVTNKSKRNGKEQKLLLKAVKKAYKAQKLLNEAIKRLEASNEKQKKKHKQSKHLDSSSTSSGTSSSSSSSSSSSTSSSSSSSDSDGEACIDLTHEVGKPSKRHHGRKHHHGRRNRRGRDRSRSRSHSRGRSRGRSRGHSRGHSRGRSRGHSRGHSKTRDLELRQLSQFFRGASLQTAPPIPHGHHQPPHHRHTRSHIRSEVIGGGGRRSRSHSHDRHNKGDHKKKRKNKKHKSAKEQTKHGAAGSGKAAHTQMAYANCPYYWCSHSRDRPHITRNERHRYGDDIAGRPPSGRPYNSVFSDIPAFMQNRGEAERLQSRGGYSMVPVYYDEVPNYRRRAHSEPRH